jgi:hypothetical protein
MGQSGSDLTQVGTKAKSAKDKSAKDSGRALPQGEISA